MKKYNPRSNSISKTTEGDQRVNSIIKSEEENISEFKLSPIAEDICRKRYYQKNENGEPIETWKDLVARVVNHVCKNEDEEYKKEIYDLIFTTKFLPNSPCLVNAGTKSKSKGLAACYVVKEPEDCWSGAAEGKVGMIENIANFGHVARQGGGAGVSLSKIRPENDPVFGSTHAKACGPIEHMRMISEVMSSITQSGFRSMAMLSTLRIDHPDIEKFIVCKQRERALKSLLKEDFFNHYDKIVNNIDYQSQVILDKFIHNFNISVLVTDDFMKKAENNEDFDLVFNNMVYKTVKAKELFNLIAENAWKNGDPGLLFYNRINDDTYKYSKQEITATNPCGEIASPNWSVCNLGSIDVSKFFDPEKDDIDWKKLGRTIQCGIRFLDNVIDASVFPTKDFEKWAKDNRPIGLGIMGFADLLLKMKIAYGKQKSIDFSNKLGKFLKTKSHEASVALAKERGTPKNCNYSEVDYRRNITTNALAPTGTISQIANCSNSIEPIFSPRIFRYDNTGKRESFHPQSDKHYFKCALNPENREQEVRYKEHIEIQATFQEYIDNAVSKTINLPNDATVEDVKNAYMLAWRSRCKGITIYRDGSKTTQVLNTQDRDKLVIPLIHAPKRPKEVNADVFKTRANGRDWHIIVGKVDNKPYEIFAVNGSQSLPEQGRVIKHKSRHYSLIDNEGKVLIENLSETEKDIGINIDKETRRFSLELRHGIHPKFIVQQIDRSNDDVASFCKAVTRIFSTKYLTQEDLNYDKGYCPDCAKQGKKTLLIFESGCCHCPDPECSYSKCG